MSGQRSVVITGGSAGIGQAMVREFLAAGDRVTYCGRNDTRLQQSLAPLREEFPGCVSAIVADVGTAQGIDKLIAAALDECGTIDILVNNGASAESGNLMSLSDAQWQSEFDQKLMAMVRTARGVFDVMHDHGGGVIVNINSVFARAPDVSFYASSVVRAGCLSFTKLLAKEGAPYGIRAVAVGLGLVATDAWRPWCPSDVSLDEYQLLTARQYAVPLERMARPEEIARVVRFLCSEDAAYITGTQVDVDGGLSPCL
ncbi:MAG TPA: SDR family oxidoreductase [Noviherbaspirillum sp.]|uniref:SDR family oxidoreductase n=1 Tax=Noviherbaspirillum sp. TaxID=1926288 RepID=UPI002B45CE00|nr:SDR family oxidoreductase [Noviherbaspirillum sp.]HJV84986.1 SDR family oxidoreductase [Noviherbaspirillum sp.]